MARFRLLLISAAYADLKEARNWYRGKSPQLSKRFSQQVNITMEQIRSFPTAHAIRYKDVRIANIAIFPYAVDFLLKPTPL